MSNLKLRLITGLILVSIISLAIIASPYSFLLLILFINFLGLKEFYTLFSNFKPYKIYGSILSISLFTTYILSLLKYSDEQVLLINIPLFFLIFIIALYSKSENPFTELAFTLIGIIYITVPLIFFSHIPFLIIENRVYEPYSILGLFLIIWASDSGAYLFGRFFGKHPLFKRISPNKTWEGSAGGAFSSLIVAYTVSHFFKELNLSDWLSISLIVILIGTFGDLIKSMLKRSLNVKDAGNILPGHGGVLDRFDSVIGSAPFVFCYLKII